MRRWRASVERRASVESAYVISARASWTRVPNLVPLQRRCWHPHPALSLSNNTSQDNIKSRTKPAAAYTSNGHTPPGSASPAPFTPNKLRVFTRHASRFVGGSSRMTRQRGATPGGVRVRRNRSMRSQELMLTFLMYYSRQ